ncbi:OmpA family protein [Pasteurella bettyae]|uniref:PF06078 family protein n=1 Tax=Pasteurella bettyae CCUG 2042 TaxID=1095749 RepID=I3DFF7_9PAST|nr:OmpA family protein [Pasteurella bettyae]EIJ70450.1 PF06078 family protein [Pasteurella bettyae CCUG 2042]SUB21080.1 outer membrane protein A [Pasteurella bettyae]
MNFDLSQLLQGPVRDLVLNQVTQKLGVSAENGGNLLTKGLSMILGGMVSKANTHEGAGNLFDLIKNTAFPSHANPLEALTGKADIDAENSLLDLGKSLLPSIFGTNTESVTNHLAASANTSADAAKGILGMLLPVVFSFFKGKMNSGLGVSALTGILGGLAKSVAPHLDSSALQSLGFKGSFDDVVANMARSSVTTSAAPSTATVEKKSGLGKWLVPALVLLAALFGYKSCSTDSADKTAATQTASTTQAPEAKAVAEVKTVEGLGNLAWNKTDKDLTVSGTVQNDSIKASLLEAFKGLAGGLPLVDKLMVDPQTGKFAFSDFAGLANLFKNFPGVSGSFADKVLNLVGSVESDSAKSSLVDGVKSVLGNLFSVNADAVKVVEPEAKEIADMSLANLDLDIVFATGSSDINPRYFRRLNALAKYFVENNRRGEIAGYTDNVGDAAANQKLSEARANAIRNYLVSQGVPADALVAVGYGQDNPIADNNTEEGRAKNRRIEFRTR